MKRRQQFYAVFEQSVKEDGTGHKYEFVNTDLRSHFFWLIGSWDMQYAAYEADNHYKRKTAG